MPSRRPRPPRPPRPRENSGTCTSFTPSSGLDSASLLDYAARLSLDLGRFRDDVTTNAHAARIERDIKEGIRNGVNATPKFYVNGERIDGKVPLEGLVAAVQAAL